MTDTPDHIKELQLKIWLSKPPGERLYRFLVDNDAMYQALRKFKLENNLPLDGLDPVGDYLKTKQHLTDKKSHSSTAAEPY